MTLITMDSIKRLLRSNCYWMDGDDDDTPGDEFIPHSCFPSLNSNLNETLVEMCEKLPFKISPALPFGKPALIRVKHLNGIDPNTELVSDKIEWESAKNDIILANLNSKSGHSSAKKTKLIKNKSCGLVKLAKHLNSDPDPNFCERYLYNWYYSEGNLKALLLNDNYVLLSTIYDSPGVLRSIQIKLSKRDCIPLEEEKISLHTDNEQDIFQIVVNKPSDFIAIRQRNFGTLFKITNGKKSKFERIHQICMRKSIVSLDVSDNSSGEFCSLTSSHSLKIWSPVLKNEPISQWKSHKSRRCLDSWDNWGCVKYLSDKYLAVGSRNGVHLNDRRTNLIFDVKWWQQTEECNFVSLVMKSNVNPNIAFVGTHHNLLELDIRKGYTKKWTHMLEYPPMYGLLSPIGSREAVFLGSQSLNELCVCETNQRIMPYLLSSPNEMIYNAKLHGKCLNPTIETRCSFSLSGLACVPFKKKRANGVYVFRKTSVGDIFYQKVTEDNDLDTSISSVFNDNSNYIDSEVLSLWEEKCNNSVESFSDLPLEITDFVDKTNTYKKLVNMEKKHFKIMSQKIKAKLNKKEEVSCGMWNTSKIDLLDTTDPLFQCLSDVWDIDEEELPTSQRKKRKRKSGDKEVNNLSKIDAWFPQFTDNTDCSGNNIKSKNNFQTVNSSNNDTNFLTPLNRKINSKLHQSNSVNVINSSVKMQSLEPSVSKLSNLNFNDSLGRNFLDDNDFVDFGGSSFTSGPTSTSKKRKITSTVTSKFSSGF